MAHTTIASFSYDFNCIKTNRMTMVSLLWSKLCLVPIIDLWQFSPGSDLITIPRLAFFFVQNSIRFFTNEVLEENLLFERKFVINFWWNLRRKIYRNASLTTNILLPTGCDISDPAQCWPGPRVSRGDLCPLSLSPRLRKWWRCC